MQLTRYIDLAQVIMSESTPAVAEVDTQNCDGVMFVGVPGTTTAALWNIQLKTGATTTGFVACSSASHNESTGTGMRIFVTDVHKPKKRWLGATFTSSGSNTDAVLLAFKYGLRAPLTSGFSCTANVPVASGGVLRVISPSSTGTG